jgi:hypothetical protein
VKTNINYDEITVPVESLRDGDRGGALGPHRKVVGKPTRTPTGRVQIVMRWQNGRTDRASLEPGHPVRVLRKIGQPGDALRFRVLARKTGTQVEVWDCMADGAIVGPDTEPVLDDDGNVVDLKVVARWMTVCVPHGGSCMHQTIALARDHAADPTGWCEECAADQAGG